jgi:FixJ family two-component response regulator
MTTSPMLLLVDDDPAVCASLKFSLELEGFEVKAFDSGEALMEQGDHRHPSCLVLDYRLPGLDGLALLQELRRRGESCPAVIITSNPTRSVRQRTSDAGAVLIEKPLLSNSLTAAITALIEGEREKVSGFPPDHLKE